MNIIKDFYGYLHNIKMGYRLVNNDNFTEEFNNNLYEEAVYVRLKKSFIIFTVLCIFAGLGIAIFSAVDITSSGLITTIKPLNPVSRSTEEGSGLLVEQNNQIVKLENTGTYDVFPGLGMIVDYFTQNYPMVSVNQTFINENVNITYYNQNMTTYLNNTKVLTTGDKSVILSPNPWNPSTGNAAMGVNETYIRESISLNTLFVSNGLAMNPNPWRPTDGDAVMTVNQTYINSNLNLSSLSQNTGIIMTRTPWPPSGSGSIVSVNQTYINSRLNMSTITATNGVYITSNTWNPATSGNANISLDQQGFLAVWTAVGFFIPIGCITGKWSIDVTGSWSKGGFSAATGVYTVPTSGIYEFNLRIQSGAVTGSIYVNVNNVNIMSIIRTGPNANIWLQKVTIPVNAGDIVCIYSDTARGYTGATTIPWLSFFGANKIGTL